MFYLYLSVSDVNQQVQCVFMTSSVLYTCGLLVFTIYCVLPAFTFVSGVNEQVPLCVCHHLRSGVHLWTW